MLAVPFRSALIAAVVVCAGLRGAHEAALSVVLAGPESYAGETYRWTAREPIEIALPLQPGVPYTLELRWGAKGDVRAGRISVGGRGETIRHGGYDGFDDVQFDVPGQWVGAAPTVVRIERAGSGAAAFVAAVRARRLEPRGAPAPGTFAVELQAEDLEGPWALQTNVPGYSDKGFRVSNAAGIAATVLRGTVTLPRAGRYAVWSRGYEGDGADRSFAVALGETRLAPTHRGSVARRFVWRRAGEAALAPGAQALVVRDAGAGFEVVDALLVTDDLAYDPDLPARLQRRMLSAEGDESFLARLVEETSAQAEAADREAQQRFAAPATRSAALEDLRTRLRGALGLEPWPPRTPLNVALLGSVERDGYRVERLTFESRPGFLVTANVYVPRGGSGAAPRVPAVLCPAGHWQYAKAQPQVQARCIGLAKLGFVALTYDPFGQGERDVPGNGHAEYFRSVLVGRNNMSYMVWDTVRALDYLLTRDDVDPARIGCTGASGGGLNTFYAAAIDERITAACPVVFVSRLREFLETGIDHCPCSHVNGLASFADEGTVLALTAPRPVLLITAADDPMFTPKGAREAMAQALVTYRAFFGAAERIEVREFPGGHDYSRPMREAMYGWARRYLRGEGDGSAFPEPAMTLEPVDSPALRCFPDGKVPATSQTVRSLCLQEAERLRGDLGAGVGQEPLRRAVGWRTQAAATLEPCDTALAQLHAAVCGRAGLVPWRARTSELGEVVCRRSRAGASGAVVLVPVLSRDESSWAEYERAAAAFESRGLAAAFLDLALDPASAHKVVTDSLLAGRALPVRRAEALVAVARALAREQPAPRAVVVVACEGDAALLALLAQACDRTFAGIVARGLPESLDDLLARDVAPSASVWRLRALADVLALVAQAGVPVTRVPADAPVERAAEEAAALAAGASR